MRKRGLLALLCALLAVLPACTATTGGTGRAEPAPQTPPATPSGSGTAAPALSFTDCSKILRIPKSAFPKGRYDTLTFDCGRLDVPLNYGEQGGLTTTLAVIRIHSKNSSTHVGSLLINPGGPGASGMLYAVELATLISDSVLNSFDLIGFDPRGVGLSSPVSCISDWIKDQMLAADPDVRTDTGLALDRAFYTNIAASCSDKYGTALAHYNTVETAKDLDQIRQAVGDRQMNYLGFSYGTELGAVYAHLYPDTVRVEVLDGAVDPATTGDPIASTEEQLKGFEDAYGQFAAWCTAHSPCKGLGDPTQALLALEQKADITPLPSGNPNDSRTATGGIVQLGAIEALYDQSLWPTLGTALLKATKNDGSGLLALADQYADRDADGHYDNLLDIFQIVTCNDQAVAKDPTDAQIQQAATGWATEYPLFWRLSAAGLASCTDWQPQRTPVPPETAPGADPILVVGNVNDPATPYVGAQRLTQTLGDARLLTLDGQGHTSYLSSSCIADKVNSYLLSAALPPPGTTCSR